MPKKPKKSIFEKKYRVADGTWKALGDLVHEDAVYIRDKYADQEEDMRRGVRAFQRLLDRLPEGKTLQEVEERGGGDQLGMREA